jgi:hypothetical protein
MMGCRQFLVPGDRFRCLNGLEPEQPRGYYSVV